MAENTLLTQLLRSSRDVLSPNRIQCAGKACPFRCALFHSFSTALVQISMAQLAPVVWFSSVMKMLTDRPCSITAYTSRDGRCLLSAPLGVLWLCHRGRQYLERSIPSTIPSKMSRLLRTFSGNKSHPAPVALYTTRQEM